MRISYKKARADYYAFSGKVSDICRQLNLAGIAVIWILRTDIAHSGGVAWTKFLIWPLALCVLGLAFDLLQYIWQTAVWGTFQHRKGKETQASIDAGAPPPRTFEVSERINWPSIGLFWGKTFFTVVAYSMLLSYMLCFLL